MNDMVGILLPQLTYKDLTYIYQKYFSLNGISGGIDNKFALISLICFLTHAQKKKTPDATCYQILRKIIKNQTIPDEFINGLSIICEDFLRYSDSFNTCGLKSVNDMIAEINKMMDNWLPF